MDEDQARELCFRLQEEALARIRADRERVASVHVARLLGEIGQRLFDPELQVDALLRWCGQDKNVSGRFATELGLPPGAYIKQARLELAARMLTETTLKVWQVGVEVGYVSPHSFGRAFKKWTDGKTPGQFREAARSESEGEPLTAPAELVSRHELKRAVDGELPPEDAEALVGRLWGLGNQICAGYQDLSPPLPGATLTESAMARNLWRWIEPLPYDVQKRAVESQAPRYRTPVLFNRLCTVSIEAGDDVRALQRADLALACLPQVAERLGKKSINFFARAYAVAGYAQRRAGELEDAARNFGIATRMLEYARDEAHPVVIAELCLYQATLEIERDNFEMAAGLSEQGYEILRLVADRLRGRMPDDGKSDPPE